MQPESMNSVSYFDGQGMASSYFLFIFYSNVLYLRYAKHKEIFNGGSKRIRDGSC